MKPAGQSKFALLLAVVFLIPGAGLAQQPGPPELVKSVGIIGFEDEGNVRDGASLLTKAVEVRLKSRFEEVEFIPVSEEILDGIPRPLLLDEAVELGAKVGVQAILDGTFEGIEIAGGTWPNLGSDRPQAKGKARWRLVGCEKGIVLVDGVYSPDKPVIYSGSIRTEKQLIRRVTQDIAGSIAEKLGIWKGFEDEQSGGQGK